eukprot:gene168-biopygen159
MPVCHIPALGRAVCRMQHPGPGSDRIGYGMNLGPAPKYGPYPTVECGIPGGGGGIPGCGGGIPGGGGTPSAGVDRSRPRKNQNDVFPYFLVRTVPVPHVVGCLYGHVLHLIPAGRVM